MSKENAREDLQAQTLMEICATKKELALVLEKLDVIGGCEIAAIYIDQAIHDLSLVIDGQKDL